MLLLLWAVIALGVWNLERAKPSAQKTVEFLRQSPFTPDLTTPERQSRITALAARINELEGEDRLRVFLTPQLRQALATLPDSEKALYLDLTEPPGISGMLEGFGNAPAERRMRWIDVALNELDQLHAGSRGELEQTLSRDVLQRIAREGLAEYLRDASVSVRIQLQPLLERIQQTVQVTR
ncbi:MAG TPA: hypothetical protein VGO90_17065 [Chthoniobacteraceae bacterium]|nr:hypothetical protein [Chthoniobacteraceae bacterium]